MKLSFKRFFPVLNILKVTVDVCGATFLVRLPSGFDDAHDDRYLFVACKKAKEI